MGTVIWLIFATLVGALIGHFAFAAMAIGALVGLIVGILIRAGGDAADLFD